MHAIYTFVHNEISSYLFNPIIHLYALVLRVYWFYIYSNEIHRCSKLIFHKFFKIMAEEERAEDNTMDLRLAIVNN